MKISPILRRRLPGSSLCALAVLCPLALVGQQGAPQPGGQPDVPAVSADTGQRVSLDRVVAVVNEDLVLESDVQDEERFAAFQPFRNQSPMTREQLIDRLIDRNLILQQLELQPPPPISDAEVDAELVALPKNIPQCVAYRCETAAGWAKFVADQGFTTEQLRARWRIRMEVLRFIEERFRMGIRISQAEIDAYYSKTLVPAYREQKAAAPPEPEVQERIQEILLQQQVTNLLDDWLKALRAEGRVRVVKSGEAMP